MEDLVNPSPAFWAGRRVLLTGHTGFKGSWLALWLRRLGAQVTGLALAPATAPHLFGLARADEGLAHHVADIRDAQAVRAVVAAARPEIVLHLAAQALVRPGYRAPLDTWAANTMGTAHVLDALRGQDSVRVAVAVTTDKVYRNREWAWPYREDDALGGHDPYSASKAAAELAVASWRDAFLAAQGVAVASARAGNVIGGGDWAEDRLLPDAVRAFAAGEPLQIRRPAAVRPWQHVLEPLAAYLLLAERLWAQPALAGAYNFGPAADEAATVRAVVELARAAYGRGEVAYGDGRAGPHEAGLLALDVSRARQSLGVRPRWPLATAVQRSMAWYRAQAEGADARALCLADIDAYEHAAP
ncbi:CDP-glucose 4,6-dehydratase [Pseudorhodoferax sp. Leaf274]|uniref:CDP-glucose 4,6-dehydratase n=1 Tax=Pseudorhodoferax sp. Leaf274 TaxID=1736318 RepID=UPI0007023FF0|nr:CDP-glucose 4,6-dehydratase [Pseudorhodoferax sp. Leaf274]KQP45014.1 CDP-glucose 4,6-dehydratase [Pseudorhodoferax sp. Leaf274]